MRKVTLKYFPAKDTINALYDWDYVDHFKIHTRADLPKELVTLCKKQHA